MANSERYRTGMTRQGGGFEAYAAGGKKYGPNGSSAPNTGATANKSGYAQRDRVAQARKNLALKRMKANTLRKTTIY